MTELLFVGFRSFYSKDKDRNYYVLEFITRPRYNNDKTQCYYNPITIFTTEEKYNHFIDENDIETYVPVNFEVNGEKVRYFI